MKTETVAVLMIVSMFVVVGFTAGFATRVILDSEPELYWYRESLPWNVDLLDVETLWGDADGSIVVTNPAMAGAGVNIAIFDTGLDKTFRDIQGNYAGGINLANAAEDNFDAFGHGTHIAATAAGAYGPEGGILGVAPLAKLWSVKVLTDYGYGRWSSVIYGAQWAINTLHDDDPTNDIDIISMSFGAAWMPLSVRDALYKAYTEGIVLVAAAGNEGPNALRSYPAALDFVISVGAVNWNLKVADFSSQNPWVDFVAPGESIYSACTGYIRDLYNAYTFDWLDYCWLSGTSTSTAHITGLVAILLGASVEPLSPSDVYDLLRFASIDLGLHGRDDAYGWGFVYLPYLFDLTDGPKYVDQTSVARHSLLIDFGMSGTTTRFVTYGSPSP